MHHDQTEVQENLTGLADADAFAALDSIHIQLRHAVEDRNYDRVQDLLAQQRAVFDKAGPLHPEARQNALTGCDTATWALTMVRLQRAHDQRALSEIAAFKKASQTYAPCVREFAYSAEG